MPLANGRQRDADHLSVVEFFNPLGESVWLATELDADGDIMFGLADFGDPELGNFSLEEMQSARLTEQAFETVGTILRSIAVPVILVQEGGYDLGALESAARRVLSGLNVTE